MSLDYVNRLYECQNFHRDRQGHEELEKTPGMVAAVCSLEGFYHSSKTYQSCIVDVAVHLK